MEKLSDYDYHLPEALIAQTPLADRAASRLLQLDKASGAVHHRAFRDVTEILNPGDLLVMNDTRVSAVRLLGNKATGGAVEFLLLKEVGDGEFESLCRPGKRLQPGAQVEIGPGLTVEVLKNLDGPTKLVRVHTDGDRYKTLREYGTVPLPPYIEHTLEDDERYQTVYSSKPGSAAAPTAGLHFTPEILDALRAKGVGIATVTLHVGIDTFRPVMVEDLSQHQMHGEECELSDETAAAIAKCQGRVIAVGTTSVRTLETFAIGPKRVASGRTVSTIFIYPGYEFKVIDGMFTNFHMPKTTMLMMISALTDRPKIMEAYRQAVEQEYRFLSFGDSMLIV